MMHISPLISIVTLLNFTILCGKLNEKMQIIHYYFNKMLFYSKQKRFPFNTKTRIGFSVATIIQYIFLLDLMISMECFLLIGIATLPMLFPLTDDIKCDLSAIQRLLRDKTKRIKMTKPLSKFIQFHSDTRRLSLIFFPLISFYCLFNNHKKSRNFQIGT